MGERMDSGDYPYNEMEDEYRGHGSQQGNDVSWTNACELLVPDMPYSTLTTPCDGLRSLSVLADGDAPEISDLANTNGFWGHTAAGNQGQSTIAQLQCDPAFGHEQCLMSGPGSFYTSSLQSPMTINSPGLWESREPWNPLRASDGAAYDRPPIHGTGTSSQWLTSGIPSQGDMSSGSNEQTRLSNPSWDLNEAWPTNATNTDQQLLTMSNLGRMSHAPVNSVLPDSYFRVVCGTPLPPTGHSVRHEEPSGQLRSRVHLDVPEVPDDTASLLSETPSTVSHILYCEHGGCRREFKGRHRRGSLHRHLRLKHRTGQDSVEQERRYFCDVRSCGKDYRRQDALLKHQRKKHPELGIPPPMSRKQEPQEESCR